VAWGRSFPLHVVTNGLFNVLLTDDGGPLADGGTNSILEAFGGSSRYLGLTITQNPLGTVQNPSEIKPRQQLVSAPFTIQAHTANHVAANGVDSMSLSNASVTTEKIAPGSVISTNIASNAVISSKIADNAVIEAKIADNAVTTNKIADGAVTSAKLNIDGDYHLNNHTIYLRDASDTSHGLTWTNSFGGQSLDGPVLFGNGSGALGTTLNGRKAALTWGNDQSVTIKGTLSVEGGSTSFGTLTNLTLGTAYTAPCDGFVTFHAYQGGAGFTLWDAVGNVLLSDSYYYNVLSGDTAWFTMPVAKGEHFRWSSPSPGSNVRYWWRPIGKNAGPLVVYNAP